MANCNPATLWFLFTMEHEHIDVTVRLNDSEAIFHKDLKHVCRILCSWNEAADEDIALRVIGGGITNLLYRLEWTGSEVC